METQAGNVYHAIAHPERRRILMALLKEDAKAMDLLAPGITPSALSQHLAVLKEAQLVTERREGRCRIYTLTPQPLFEPFAWLSQYEAFWRAKMQGLGDYLETTHGRRKKKNRT